MKDMLKRCYTFFWKKIGRKQQKKAVIILFLDNLQYYFYSKLGLPSNKKI